MLHTAHHETPIDPHAVPHGHHVSLDTGLDFINTLELEKGSWQDHLATPEAALEWLIGHNLLHPDARRAELARIASDAAYGEKLLAKVRRVRGAMRELVDASGDRRPPRPRRAGRGEPGPAHALRDRPRARARRRHDGPPPRGRPDRGRHGPPHRVDRALPRRGQDRPAARLRQRELQLGLLRLLAHRPPQVVRHDDLRQPRQGRPTPRAPQGRGRRAGARRGVRPDHLSRTLMSVVLAPSAQIGATGPRRPCTPTFRDVLPVVLASRSSASPDSRRHHPGSSESRPRDSSTDIRAGWRPRHRQGAPSPGRQVPAPHYPRMTRLTRRPPTWMTLSGAFPPSAACTFSRARTIRSISSWERPAGSSTLSRSLPLTWLVSSISRATIVLKRRPS